MGKYGKFFIIVKDDTIKFKTSLKNLDGLFVGPVNYHFHSGYVGGEGGEGFSAGEGNTCGSGSTFTLGHYDPTLACGKASTAPPCDNSIVTGCCPAKPAPGYCDSAPCEVGDLGKLYGTIPIEDGEAEADVEDDVYEFFLDQYLGSGTPTYETWASIVFHDSGDGAKRKLCGNLIEA